MHFLKLEEMTIEQKIGMVMCARRFTEEDVDFIVELVKKRALGCVQPYAEQTDIIKRIVEAADYPLLVFNDTERGFPTAPTPKTPLISLAACDNEEYYKAYAKGVVHYAQEAGYNGTWGPVIDVLTGDGPCAVHRSFSDKPEKVAECAEIIAKIYKQNHYLSTGKHYPGFHEHQIYDTHMTEGSCGDTRETMLATSLVPYKKLLEKDLLPCVMSMHTVYHNVDPDHPATLSKKVIDILRNDVGFDGVLFTDSLAMMGILQKYGEENVYGMAIGAGVDIVLCNYCTSVKDCYEMIKKNFEDGLFSEERLDEAVRRVLKAMEFVGTKPENPTVFTDEDMKTLEDVSKACITAVTDEDVPTALTGEDKDRLFIILTENNFVADSDGAEITATGWYHPENIAKKIKENFPNSGIAYVKEFSDAGSNERVLREATKYKEVVFVTFCMTGCYIGTDGLTRRTEALFNSLALSGKISTVLHFGNPYALKNLLHVPRRIFGYHIPESQEHAIDVLAGKLEAKGKVPFEIELQ